MKVYVVTVGVYSSYEIDRIYTDRGMAERRQVATGGNEIEKYELDPPPDSDDEREGTGWWSISMDREGNDANAWPEQPPNKRHPQFSVRGNSDIEPRIFVTWIHARSKKQAIKAANERRGVVIATGRWRVTPAYCESL